MLIRVIGANNMNIYSSFQFLCQKNPQTHTHTTKGRHEMPMGKPQGVLALTGPEAI